MKALIKVGYGCNDHCTFCHTLDVRDVEGSAREVSDKIRRARALGHTMVVLSGGEPTMRPELGTWAAEVARLGMDFGLVTNGRRLAYAALVEELLGHRLRYVYLSLHGGTARVHNALVRADAFTESYGAIANLHGRVELTVNCVVTAQNLTHLRGVVDALLPYGKATLKFSMVQPKGGGDKLFDAITPRVSDVAERVQDAIAYGLERVGDAEGPRFSHDGIPLCLLPGLEDRYDDLKTHAYASMVEIGEPDFFPVDDRDKLQPPACAGCALRGACPGLYRGYHERFGAHELRPVTVAARARPNSFNYVLEKLVREPDAARCPLRDGAEGVTPWDTGRHLWVRNGERVARFVARTRDFSDEELRATKATQGQLYLDVSRKDAPDDFARDLVKLERAAACGACVEDARCTGMHVPVDENVFERDDARVAAIVAALEGDVLDVGCGEGRYEEALAAATRSGRMRYRGIDPDAARIASLRARWPWASLSVGAAEALALDGAIDRGIDRELDGELDAVLFLRSWNHLRDPRAAVAQVVSRLRPGGTLLIVDNGVFGLARTVAQAARAEGGPSLWEHLRNDGPDEAHAVVEAAAIADLTLVAREDIGPATSNQWLLHYRRAGGPQRRAC